MKLLLIAVSLLFGMAQAKEVIAIQSPYSASHSGTPAMQKILNEANQMQDKFHFILEFRPGGEQLLAVKALDDSPQSRLAIIAPKFVEHTRAGRLSLLDYHPVHALGDACWAVITNVGDSKAGIESLRGLKTITVGGVGVGNATHLTSLQLGQRFGMQIQYVPFRSNFDALVLMTGDGSINLVIDRVVNFQQFKEKNSNLKILAMSCSSRHPSMPDVPTLKEQGVLAPLIFNITVAHKSMDQKRRSDIAKILQTATEKIGIGEIQRLSDMTPPAFAGTSLETYFANSIKLVDSLLQKYQHEIAQ